MLFEWYLGHHKTLDRMIADSFVSPILTTTASAFSRRGADLWSEFNEAASQTDN